MSVKYIVGIVSGADYLDQYTISEVEFNNCEHALEFVSNYNRKFDATKSNYIRAQYFGEFDTVSGNYVS